MMFIVKDEKQKGLSLTSGISAYLGITEPAIFGMNLRYRFPFIIAMVSSGLAGMYISSQGVLASSVGVGGVPGIFSIMSQTSCSVIAAARLLILVLLSNDCSRRHA